MTYTTESFPVIFVFETSCGSIISTMSDDSSATSDITPRPIDLTNPTSPVLTPAPVVQRAPRPADEAISLSSIWESDMIETFHEEKRNKSTGVMQLVSRWRYHHCMEDWAGNNIWVSAANDETMSHEWHKHYSLPHTKVFGDVACVSTPTSLGMGQAERIWKIVKANKKGNRSKMSPDKSKKQAIISAAYSHKKNEARRKAAQRAGVLWTDKDFKFCKLDNYLAAPVNQLLRQRIFRVFKAYREQWEKVQFGSKGDDIHEAMVCAKYGRLKYKDADVGGRVGAFMMNNCMQLTKCMKSGPRKTQTQKTRKGKGYFYKYGCV